MNSGHQLYVYAVEGSNTQETIPDANGSNAYYAHDAVSTTFKPGNFFDGMFSDMAITSSDYTVYYLHRQHLARVSTNAFDGILAKSSFSNSVLETAGVFNIVIYTVYGMSCTHHNPSLDTIEAALDALVKYGVDPQLHASPSQPLYPLLLSHAPHRPIDAYAIAGKWAFDDAAVAISAHLLAFELSGISDALSIKMGPVYLRRLVDLHCNRANALKSLALRPPVAHPPTLMCAGRSQARLASAWAFEAAKLAWATLPGMSTNALQSMFRKAGNGITCQDCQAALQARIQEVCSEWSEVKRTI